MNVWMAGTNQMAVVGLAALLNTLWYAAAVVGLTWAALRFLQRVNAATRYWIWTAVLAFLVILPFLPALVSRLETAGAPATVAPLATVAAAPEVVHQHLAPVTLMLDSTPGPNHWPLYLLALWMVIAGWQLFLLLRGVVSVRRLKAHAKAAPGAAMTIELRRRAEVLASDEISSPVAVGYIHPAVILPTGLPASLDEGEIQDVLLHELAHLARFDDWLNLASRGLGALLVLHPLAAIVLRQIEREREMACDDFVVAHTGSARNYARSLARLHDLRASTGTRLLAPALLGGKVSLADRIESLLRRGRKFSARPSLANLSVSALFLAVLLGAGGLVPGWIAIAQTQGTSRPSFEVVSIKPSKAWHQPIISPVSYSVSATALTLIYDAYGPLLPGAVSGWTGWSTSEMFSVDAKVDGKSAAALQKLPPKERARQRQLMLQSLLADRFNLKVHHGTKVFPVYELVVAKGGSKMKKSQAAETNTNSTGRLKAKGMPMADLALLLTMMVNRFVIDKTGLPGTYDFDLHWMPEGLSDMPEENRQFWPEKNSGPEKISGPSIFTALREQLGLKLKSAKGPVDMLVIDHIDRPTPN